MTDMRTKIARAVWRILGQTILLERTPASVDVVVKYDLSSVKLTLTTADIDREETNET